MGGNGARACLRIVLCLGIVFGFLLTTNASAVAATSGMVEGVPWYQQTRAWVCGPTALEMVFDFYGPHIDQREIAFAANWMIPSAGGGYLSDLVRAGHFSDRSKIDVSNCKIVGYTGRGLGYAAFFYNSNEFWLEGLKALIDQGYPVIYDGIYSLETAGNSDTVPLDWTAGHVRVIVGYDDTTQEVIVIDPWGRDIKQLSDIQGSTKDNPGYDSDFTGIRYGYDYFQQLWSWNSQYSNYRYSAVFIAPWHVEITSLQGTGTELTVTAEVTYPCPKPFYSWQYPASEVQVGITLPAELTLAPGETATKTVGWLGAGETVQVIWNVHASPGSYGVSVLAQGIVHDYFAGVACTDRIGGEATTSIVVPG